MKLDVILKYHIIQNYKQHFFFFSLVVDFYIILTLVKCKTDGHVYVSAYYTYILISIFLIALVPQTVREILHISNALTLGSTYRKRNTVIYTKCITYLLTWKRMHLDRVNFYTF